MDMTISEAMTAKFKLEADMLALLRIFQRDTGLTVVSVNLASRVCFGEKPGAVTGVQVRCELAP